MRPRSRYTSTTLAVGALTVLAAALRFPTLDVQSFYIDEAYTFVIAITPALGDSLSIVGDTESTPPLYYVLVWGWEKVFGSGEVGLRSLSALLGTAAVPVTYRAGATLVGVRTGVIAAALVAVSPLLVWYSQEARSYALLIFLAALSALLFARALRAPSRGRLALWALCGAALLATHYFAAFVVAAEGAWLFAGLAGRRVEVAAALGGVGAAGAALLPLALGQQAADRTSWISDIPLGQRIEDATKVFLTGPGGAPGAGLGLLAFLLAAAGGWLLLRRTEGDARRGALAAAGVGALALAAPLAFSLAGVDYFFTRNLIGAWPLLAIALAAGFAAGGGRRGVAAAGALSLTLAAVVVSVPFREEIQRTDWRGLGEELKGAHGTRAVVVVPAWDHVPLRVYRQEVEPMGPFGLPLRELVLVASDGTLAAAEDSPQGLGPPPGFQEAGREAVQELRIVRYRSERDRLVTPASVRRWTGAAGMTYSGALVQGAAPSG